MIGSSSHKIINGLLISVYGAYYIRLFADIYLCIDKAQQVNKVCVCADGDPRMTLSGR